MTAGQFITIAQGTAGLGFFPSLNSLATGHVTVQASIGATDAGLGGAPVTSDITINPVPDEPSVTTATTPEDTQTTSGLVITRNAVDGPEVTHFKILDIFNGTLFKHDGVTPINANDVITAAEGAEGLRFTPAPNYFGSNAGFAVIGAVDAAGTLNGASASGGFITVTPVADTPSIDNVLAPEDGISDVIHITRNPADGAEVTHYKVIEHHRRHPDAVRERLAGGDRGAVHHHRAGQRPASCSSRRRTASRPDTSRCRPRSARPMPASAAPRSRPTSRSSRCRMCRA